MANDDNRGLQKSPIKNNDDTIAHISLENISSDSVKSNNVSFSNDSIIVFLLVVIGVGLICFFRRNIFYAIDKIIGYKVFRWLISYVGLPIATLWLAGLVDTDMQRYVYALAIVISIAISERSSHLTKVKHEEEIKYCSLSNEGRVSQEISRLQDEHLIIVREKDSIIFEKDLSIRRANSEIVSRVKLLRDGYVAKLYDIASDHKENDCIELKRKIKDIAQEIMTSSGLLNTMEEVDVGLRNKSMPMPSSQSKAYEMIFNRK